MPRQSQCQPSLHGDSVHMSGLLSGTCRRHMDALVAFSHAQRVSVKRQLAAATGETGRKRATVATSRSIEGRRVARVARCGGLANKSRPMLQMRGGAWRG